MEFPGRQIPTILESEPLLSGDLEDGESQRLRRIDQPLLDLARLGGCIEIGCRMTRLDRERTTAGPSQVTEMRAATQHMS
jgi:hypothetical protein